MYAVFGYYGYYPDGGTNDLIAVLATKQDAEEFVRNHRAGLYCYSPTYLFDNYDVVDLKKLGSFEKRWNSLDNVWEVKDESGAWVACSKGKVLEHEFELEGKSVPRDLQLAVHGAFDLAPGWGVTGAVGSGNKIILTIGFPVEPPACSKVE